MDLTSWQSRTNGFIQTHSKNIFKCHLIKVHLVGKYKKHNNIVLNGPVALTKERYCWVHDGVAYSVMSSPLKASVVMNPSAVYLHGEIQTSKHNPNKDRLDLKQTWLETD